MVQIAYTPPSPWSQIGAGLGSIGRGMVEQQRFGQQQELDERQLDIMEQRNLQNLHQWMLGQSEKEYQQLTEILSTTEPESPERGFRLAQMAGLRGKTQAWEDEYLKAPYLGEKKPVTEPGLQDIKHYQQMVEDWVNSSYITPAKEGIAVINRQAPKMTEYQFGEKGTLLEKEAVGLTESQKPTDEQVTALDNYKKDVEFGDLIMYVLKYENKDYSLLPKIISMGGFTEEDRERLSPLRHRGLLREIKKIVKERGGVEAAQVPAITKDTSIRRQMELTAKKGGIPQWYVGLPSEIKAVVDEFRKQGLTWDQIRKEIKNLKL